MRRNRQFASVRLAVLAALSLVLAAGCADQPGGGSGADTPDGSASAGDAAAQAHEPVDLIGMWTVAEAGEDGGTVLRLAHQELTLWLSCGWAEGSWRADQNGLFIADSHGFGGCLAGEPVTPPWLREAAAYEVDGDDAVLLDAEGSPVVRLTAGGKPPANPDMAPELAQPPTVTDEARKAFAPAAPLPAALAPATRDELVGRWVPADADRAGRGGRRPAHVEFAATGEWRGSDGCNGQAGRWVAGDEGALLATAGPSTLIGCDNVPVGAWLHQARRAGLDGDVLVLFDAEGKELGKLRRSAG